MLLKASRLKTGQIGLAGQISLARQISLAGQISLAEQISLTGQISLAGQIGLARQIGLAFPWHRVIFVNNISLCVIITENTVLANNYIALDNIYKQKQLY
jgi:hypothetical protein